MRETQGIIERVRQIGGGWQQIELTVEDAGITQLKPGQTLLIRTDDSLDPYLRDHWIPVNRDAEDGTLIIERPLTRRHSPGDVVNIIGPVGSAFPLRPNTRHLLLLALDYAPARLLHLMNHALATQQASVTLILTGAAREYPVSNLPPVVEVITSPEALLWPDQKQSFGWADQIFAVTSPVFVDDYYSALFEACRLARHALPAEFLYGIYDLPLPCGTGACMACLVRYKHDHRAACVDGAAFDLAQVRLR